jgi:hypothetical protein
MTYKISRSEHGYRILSSSIVAIQIGIVFRVLEILKTNVESFNLIVLAFLVIIWLIIEILIQRVYLKR